MHYFNENRLVPFSTLTYPESTARNGDKIWTKVYTDEETKIRLIYKLCSSGIELFRCML